MRNPKVHLTVEFIAAIHVATYHSSRLDMYNRDLPVPNVRHAHLWIYFCTLASQDASAKTVRLMPY